MFLCDCCGVALSGRNVQQLERVNMNTFQIRSIGQTCHTIECIIEDATATGLLLDHDHVFVLRCCRASAVDKDGNRKIKFELVPGNGIAEAHETQRATE